MSDIQEQIKLAHKRAEENDIKLLKEEIKEILDLMQEIVDENQDEFGYHKKLLDYITNLQEENERLNNIIDTLKIEISSLMSRYFYEKDFYIEDADLDKLLRIIDGDIEFDMLKALNENLEDDVEMSN